MTKMYKLLIIVLFTLFHEQVMAQFGVNLIYQSPTHAVEWDDLVDAADGRLQSQGMGISLDYWFRLKNRRIEFLAEVGALWGSDQNLSITSSEVEVSWNAYLLGLSANVYLFDLEGDCNCPTFGKDGGLFKKGFYVQAGGGMQNLHTRNRTDLFETGGGSFSPYVYMGVGLDIGLGEYLTMTPWLRYNYRFNTDWKGLDAEGNLSEDADAVSSSGKHLSMGIRLGYRWDYKKRYR